MPLFHMGRGRAVEVGDDVTTRQTFYPRDEMIRGQSLMDHKLLIYCLNFSVWCRIHLGKSFGAPTVEEYAIFRNVTK